MQVQEWIIERQQLLERIKELEAENAELRKKLGCSLASLVSSVASLLGMPIRGVEQFWGVIDCRCRWPMQPYSLSWRRW